MLRWVLGGILSIGVGIYFLIRYMSGVPALEQLETVTGVVNSAVLKESRSRRSTSLYLQVQIGDKPAATYRERFGDFQRVAGSIREGDKVKAWIDVGKNNYIWQLEKNGERIVSYDKVADEEKSNKFWNGILGLVFVVTGIGIVIAMAVQWKKSSSPQPEQEANAE